MVTKRKAFLPNAVLLLAVVTEPNANSPKDVLNALLFGPLFQTVLFARSYSKKVGKIPSLISAPVIFLLPVAPIRESSNKSVGSMFHPTEIRSFIL